VQKTLRIGPYVATVIVLLAVSYFGVRSSKAQQPEAAGSAPKSVLDMDVIPRTPERLARGKYLVEGVGQCPACHSEHDFSKRPFEIMPGRKLGGWVFPSETSGAPAPNLIVAPNISPDPEYGAGTWKDADFVHALRQGIGHDGRTLYPLMPYPFFRNISDEDLAAIIVYERSQAPVHIQRPKTYLVDDLKKAFQPLPPVAHVAEPDHTNQVEYGKYLANAAHCSACHTPTDDHGMPIAGMEFGGGSDIAGPWTGGAKIVHINALNITPDASGIGYFDEAMFIDVIRNGGFKTRPLMSIMPWDYFRNLSDDDLKAIFAYLKSVKPVVHHVDNTEPPTYCKVCRTKHGLGEMNELPSAAASAAPIGTPISQK
jgi:mono/diheme cytochrome c family protein